MDTTISARAHTSTTKRTPALMPDRLPPKAAAALVEKLRSHADAGENPYRHLFESCRSMILILHPETGTILDANKAARRYYGCSRSDIATMTAMDLDPLGWDEIIADALSGDPNGNRIFHFRRYYLPCPGRRETSPEVHIAAQQDAPRRR